MRSSMSCSSGVASSVMTKFLYVGGKPSVRTTMASSSVPLVPASVSSCARCLTAVIQPRIVCISPVFIERKCHRSDRHVAKLGSVNLLKVLPDNLRIIKVGV
jgi:hypothetical protein